jgi:putative peptidoglycan lipid II flippase
MVPGLVGSGVGQINLTIDTIIGTLLPAGSVSLMYFADRINQLPLGVLGSAAGTTLLPVLTRHLAAGDHEGAHTAQNRSIEYVLLLTLPAVAGILVLADPIMVVLFGHGSFTEHDALLSAQSLRAYAIGLPAFVLVKVLSPAFFARGDTRTPVIIGIAILVVNLLLNLAFMKPLAHVGPPLASSLAAGLNVASLAVILRVRAVLYVPRLLLVRMGLVCLAALGMACGVGAAMWEMPFPTHILPRLFWLGLMVSGGSVLYVVLLCLTGIMHFRQLVSVPGRLKRGGRNKGA